MNRPKYPKGEHAWTGYYNKEGELRFLLTSKENDRSWFFLYENLNGELKKLGKAKTPAELEEKYHVAEAIGVNTGSAGKTGRKKKTEGSNAS